MGNDQPDTFTLSLIQSYHLMQEKGHWMDAGIIELKNGEKFSYKITRLKDKKKPKRKNKK